MKPKDVTITLVALMALSATSQAQHPRHLRKIENPIAYQLAQDYVVVDRAVTFTLKKGTYHAAFEDAKALYLIGGADCLEMHVAPYNMPNNAYTMQFNCGAYYPKASTGQARFFYIRGAIERNAELGLVINAMIKAGEGGFKYPVAAKLVGDLRSKLVLAKADEAPAPDGP